MELGLHEDVSLVERCPHFSVCLCTCIGFSRVVTKIVRVVVYFSFLFSKARIITTAVVME